MPGPRVDPIFYPDDGMITLRIRGDDDVETEIEWSWEQIMDLGACLIEHALMAKRHSEPKPLHRQGKIMALAGPAGGDRTQHRQPADGSTPVPGPPA